MIDQTGDDDPHSPSDAPGDDPRADALGHAVKVIRTGLGLGRPEVAERAGLSYSYLAEIENGKKQASAAAQRAIAKALGMSVSELLRAAEEWAYRMAGSEVGATPLWSIAAADAVPVPGILSPATVSASSHEIPPALGARERTMRWFRDSTATRVWDRSEIEKAIPEGTARRTRRAAKDESLEATLDQLREILRRLPPEDRERVLDLARRLTEG